MGQNGHPAFADTLSATDKTATIAGVHRNMACHMTIACEFHEAIDHAW
ncbi:MAG: hypothetical protein WCL44_11780 [bacterium]